MKMKAMAKQNASSVRSLESKAKSRRVSADLAPKATIAKAKASLMNPRRVSTGGDLAAASKAIVSSCTSFKSTKSCCDSGENSRAPAMKVPQRTPPPQSSADRTTMLKTRFAVTILKAQRELLGSAAVRVKPKKRQPTIKELRLAARRALEKVEQTVVVEDNLKSFRDMERLCGFTIPYVGGFQNRMQYYGLYLKK